MIIAVDFDGTIVENKYPEIGKPIESTIKRLRTHKANGDKLILWTCRVGKQLLEAVDFCRWDLGIEFDAVNDNLLESQLKYGDNPRKIFADEYWDDRAVQIKGCNNEF